MAVGTQRKKRTIKTTADKAADPAQPVAGARKAALPTFVPPSLATLMTKAPDGGRWIHEIKFDGYRIQARVEAGRVKLLTRTGLDWTKKFGKAIIADLQALPVGKALIDGELVVESAAGASDFSALQADLSEGRADRFTFYAFDLLYLDGYDLRNASLIDRKAALERILPQGSPALRLSAHFVENGDIILRHACRLSLEGVVSKLRDAPYQSGRNKNWIKSKCTERQEFVIGGYVPSTTSRKAIGSLLLGVYERGKLNCVGRVGTGFTAAVAEDLFRRLDRLRQTETPFSGTKPDAEARRKGRYVRPDLVAEVEVRGWTADDRLRHASFRGLRDDKKPTEVVRESKKAAIPVKQHTAFKLTHPDRLYWPDAGVTKEGLADYYADVWRRMGPLIVGRPLSLLRCPGGVTESCFFQKHAWKGLSKDITLVNDPADKATEPLISIGSLDGLIGLVQAAVLEIHPWGARLTDWEKPDYITMDLDPGEGVTWDEVISAAQEVRRRLEDAGLAAFVKTSGGKGLHVVSPLKPKALWPAVKAFTKAMADSMAADDPARYVSTVTKSKRGGKILIDYLRNGRGATAVAAYSTRARPGAAVSMPLHWDELNSGIGPAYFTVMNTPTRLASLKSDPWEDFLRSGAPIKEPTKRKRAA
ncbi:MAG: DNA ligase D [Dongiaceae bacterium]